MRPYCLLRASGLILGAVLFGSGTGLHAAGGPSDTVLAKHGLKRAGNVLALQAESEVHAKAEEVRQLSRQLSYAVAQQRSTFSEKEYQDTIKGYTAEINQLKNQSNAALQTMNRIPRRRGYPVNNIVAEEYQELALYRNSLAMEINWRQTFVNQLKSKPFDPKDRVKADTEVRDRTEALHQGALDLRKLVDGIHEKYAALEKDPQVKKWLNTPEGSAGVKPKLGPSRAFLQDEKMLERVERQTSPDEPFSTSQPAKASRKGRHGTKVKHATKSANTASPF